ncbi:hypothetical protein [Anaerobaca lacustris]|uniref:Uncharacterized protein n=1 Tax=Anaerobaca lacustris TaxID=3044600 RepID=A0AAW6TTV0_9BACT|nr:hypothetical protein [Sedimentisphaerales bacterium M17dextr]
MKMFDRDQLELILNNNNGKSDQQWAAYMEAVCLVEIRDVLQRGLADLVEVVKAADRGRNDALSVVGSIKAASQTQDVEIQAIKDRLAALEKERVRIANAAIEDLRHRVERLNEFVAGLEANASAQSDALDANEQAVQSCLSTLGGSEQGRRGDRGEDSRIALSTARRPTLCTTRDAGPFFRT